MPIVDMPIEQLRKYFGTNEKPSDFDEYWNNNIKIAGSLDTKTEIVPDSFKNPAAEFYHIYFTGTGNARVHAKLVVPKNHSGKCPALLHFHGYSGRSADYETYMCYSALGFVVAALDCRGQGGYSFELGEGVHGDTMIGQLALGIQLGKENLLYKHMFLDTYLLSKIVKSLPFVDSARIGVFGGSQGGGLSVACAALDPDIKMLAPVYPFLSDYRRVWNMDLAKGAYSSVTEYFRRYDPCHEHEDEIFSLFGYIDVHNLAPRIKGKMLMFTGLMDTTCPASTQFAIFNNASCEKKHEIYPDFGHEGLPYSGEKTITFLSELL
jgi:cephalosporin-C deacetylase